MITYISFEGVIGSGKTTLARSLASLIGADLILEGFEGNEFLPEFYKDSDRWALPMQLWFLTSRHEQLANLEKRVERAIVADYSFAKEAIFARILLRIDREYALYSRLSAAMQKQLREPDLTVYLDAKNERLLERIRKRNRPYEATIDDAYLNRVRAAYEVALEKGSLGKVICIDTTNLHLDSPEELHAHLAQIMKAVPDKNSP